MIAFGVPENRAAGGDVEWLCIASSIKKPLDLGLDEVAGGAFDFKKARYNERALWKAS